MPKGLGRAGPTGRAGGRGSRAAAQAGRGAKVAFAHRVATALAVGRRSRTTRGSGSRVCAGSTKSVLERGLTTQACSVAPPQRADQRCRVDALVEEVRR